MKAMAKLFIGFIKRVIVIAVVILVLSFIIGLIFTGFNIYRTIRDLDIYTLMVSLLAIVGKILGALTPSARLTATSIAAPSTAGYAHKVARRVVEDPLLSWITLLLAIALAYGIALALRNMLL